MASFRPAQASRQNGSNATASTARAGPRSAFRPLRRVGRRGRSARSARSWPSRWRRSCSSNPAARNGCCSCGARAPVMTVVYPSPASRSRQRWMKPGDGVGVSGRHRRSAVRASLRQGTARARSRPHSMTPTEAVTRPGGEDAVTWPEDNDRRSRKTGTPVRSTRDDPARDACELPAPRHRAGPSGAPGPPRSRAPGNRRRRRRRRDRLRLAAPGDPVRDRGCAHARLRRRAPALLPQRGRPPRPRHLGRARVVGRGPARGRSGPRCGRAPRARRGRRRLLRGAPADELVVPLAEAFTPTWLLVSAGFDAHRADPLTGLGLAAGDYADLTRRLLPLVARGRVVAFLEGGYDLEALALSAGACVAALAGDDYRPEAATAGGAGRAVVDAALRLRSG